MITANNATLADRMRDARKRAGLKQRDLTHIASRSQIGRIERGEVYSPETIDAWAAACGVSAEWLRTGIVEAPQAAVQATPAVEQSSTPEAPAEADRSGWPVLTKARAMAGYYHPNGTMAIEPYYGVFRAWPATWETLPVHPIGKFDTAVDAAEALGARLPDEVSKANHLAADPLPAPTEAEAVEIEREASAGAIAAIVRLGHTDHCAKRLAWGDGECECGSSGRPLHPATSALLTTLAGLDEDDVLSDIYGIERGCEADLDMAVYAWLDAGSPDAGNDLQFGPEVTPQPPPTNTTGDVWQELIDAEPPGRIRDLMAARREQGIAKYGRPLGRENGRDHAADAIQEALDGMVYAVAGGRMMAQYAFRDALDLLTGADATGWVRRELMDTEIAALTARAESAEAEVARLRAALEGQSLANAPLRDALSFLRGRLAFLVPGDDATDAAIVAAAKALADRDDGQDDALLDAGLGLLDQAALGNPTLGYIATVIRRGVGRG